LAINKFINRFSSYEFTLSRGQDLLLTTRSLRSLDTHRLFALPTMAKQKVIPSGKLHMRKFFTRERDDSFSPASRGTEMLASP